MTNSEQEAVLAVITALRTENALLRDALRDLNSHASHAENLIAELAIPGASEYFREMHIAQIAARAALATGKQP